MFPSVFRGAGACGFAKAIHKQFCFSTRASAAGFNNNNNNNNKNKLNSYDQKYDADEYLGAGTQELNIVRISHRLFFDDMVTPQIINTTN